MAFLHTVVHQWQLHGIDWFLFYHTTQKEKKRGKKSRTLIWADEKDKKKKSFWFISAKVILNIFKSSFILDQSQICISSGLGARACQSYLLICNNAHFSMGLQTENGNVFTHSYAISKRIKLELLDWSQMKDIFKSFLMV